jgi:uncharacterized protein with ATP-grasp and redox domains
MRFSYNCRECLLSRVAFEADLATDDPVRSQHVAATCGCLLDDIGSLPVPAPVIASRIHRLAYLLSGTIDPYYLLKQQNNRDALAACRTVRNRLSGFRSLCTAAVIANTLDYGSLAHRPADDFGRYFNEQFNKGLFFDDTQAIERLCQRVVYLTDNCGEIVFDRLVLTHLREKGAHITVAVRGAPILNDATMEDALALGLDTIADQLTTTSLAGTAELGLNPACMPADLHHAIEDATLIIAKGMANYESLSELSGLPPVAYLMAVKCEPIARSAGAPLGSMIALLRSD